MSILEETLVGLVNDYLKGRELVNIAVQRFQHSSKHCEYCDSVEYHAMCKHLKANPTMPYCLINLCPLKEKV